MSSSVYVWYGGFPRPAEAVHVWNQQSAVDVQQVVVHPHHEYADVSAWDWDSETNPCWAYTSEQDWLDDLPIGSTPVVPIQTGGADFYTNLMNTVEAQGGRCIVQLEAGVYELDQFRMIGSSGDPGYSFGFWHRDLAGLLGRGPDQTFVQLAPDSMNQALLDAIQGMSYAAAGGWATLQAGVIRMDGTEDSPICVGGITFRSADQQDITSLDSSFDTVGVVTPQPAPHRGLQIYRGSWAHLSHVRFRAFGRAVTSAPPFECPSLNSQLSRITLNHVEIDGRRDPVFDPARPRRSAVYLMNDEHLCDIRNSHFHHSNLSRYAVNDENYNTRGVYRFERSKIEEITTTRNDGLGGWTDASCFGWESTAATIEIVDSIVCMDNPNTSSGQKPMHLQLTKTGGKDRTGGQLRVVGTEFRSSGQPQLDGWVLMRLGRTTQWYTEGATTRMDIRHPVTNNVLLPHFYSGTWPPDPAELKALGLSRGTHYIAQLIG